MGGWIKVWRSEFSQHLCVGGTGSMETLLPRLSEPGHRAKELHQRNDPCGYCWSQHRLIPFGSCHTVTSIQVYQALMLFYCYSIKENKKKIHFQNKPLEISFLDFKWNYGCLVLSFPYMSIWKFTLGLLCGLTQPTDNILTIQFVPLKSHPEILILVLALSSVRAGCSLYPFPKTQADVFV